MAFARSRPGVPERRRVYEGEMKTAFENWLLATKQTSGHGQCRLYRTATRLWLTPFEGRRCS